MSDTTPILALPVLVPGQAQPYVTHNGALRRLDVLVQLVVEAFDAETPPELPEEGQVYALGAVPTAAWAGQPQNLAAWIDDSWLFIAPQTGWRGYDRQSGELRLWDGSAWRLPAANLDQVAGLGINTDHDTSNRLAVKAEATLLSHEGAGHQLKINKAAAAETASLLFQSNWSGRAEMGLAGGNDWTLKVSADGSAWREAMTIDRSSGAVALGQHPKFSGYCDYDQYNAAGAWFKVDINTLRHNDQGAVSSGTFTAPLDGYYSFYGSIRHKTNGTAPGVIAAGFAVNGSAPTSDRTGFAGAGTADLDDFSQCFISALCQLSGGDTVELWALFLGDNAYLYADFSCFTGYQIP